MKLGSSSNKAAIGGLRPPDLRARQVFDEFEELAPQVELDSRFKPQEHRSVEAPAVEKIGQIDLIAEQRISVGVMRQELSKLIEKLMEQSDLSRNDRIAIWVLRSELRKLNALDGFMSGFIRG